MSISASFLCLIAIMLFLHPCQMTDPGVSQLFIDDNKIYDDQGGTRIFHGINIAPKNKTIYENLGPENWTELQNLGFNGIRMGLQWWKAQPEKPKNDQEWEYNETYFEVINKTVTEAGYYGIYTLVQLHQDVFNHHICGGGTPLWILDQSTWKSFPSPLNVNISYDNYTGLPVKKTCQKIPWSKYYLSKASNLAFQQFWSNKYNALTIFQNFWKKVAETFKYNRYVIGFQIMNEPWPGNLYKNPLVMVPTLSEKFHLQRAYDRVATAIRSVDPKRIIGFQPVTWLQSFRSGFSHPPGGMRYGSKSLFCYHFYRSVVLDHKYGFTIEKFLQARRKDTIRLGSGGMLSQFFITSNQGHKNTEIMDFCDKNSHSWLGWQYESGLAIVDEVKRTFAHRVAGDIVLQSFNYQTKDYYLQFKVRQTAGKTKIFIGNGIIYGKGFEMKTSPANMELQVVDNMYVQIDSGKLFDNMNVKIEIQSKEHKMNDL